MSKTLHIAAVAALMALTACSGGNAKKEAAQAAADNEAFYEVQPIKSGEYRAVSFQYGDARTDRERFDGRVIVALKPSGSGILIYENGNRTHFRATLPLKEAFAPVEGDTVFMAMGNKGSEVRLICGSAETDTLAFDKDGRQVKVAFEKKPSPELTPADAWQRINDRLK